MWLPILSAFLGIIAFLPFNFYPVAFVFLVPLFIFFLREEKLWRLIAGALLFRLLFSLGTVYFTLDPILWAHSLLIFSGLPIAIWIVKRISARLHLTSYTLHLAFLPFTWTLFDLAQAQYSFAPTYIFSAGNALGSSPFLGLARIGGFTVLTFFVAIINTLLAALFLMRRRNPQATCGFRLQVIVFVILIFAGWQISSYELRKNADAYAALPNSITIAAVSTDGTQNSEQFAQLKQELSDRPADLIILPENMSGRTTSRHDEFQNLSREFGTDVLAAYDTFVDAKKYNSSILFDTQGGIVGVHNKNRLAFGGEYWPFGSWRPPWTAFLIKQNPGLAVNAMFEQKNADAPGERNLLSITVGGNPVFFAAPICIEINYPLDLAEYRAQGARFIVNQSSNRWIIRSGLKHFLYLSSNLKKIESVALRLPIISSGVDDFAGIAMPDGKMLLAQMNDKNYVIFFGAVRY